MLKLRSLHMTTTITTESEESPNYDCPSKIQAVYCKIGCVRLTHKIFVFDNVQYSLKTRYTYLSCTQTLHNEPRVSPCTTLFPIRRFLHSARRTGGTRTSLSTVLQEILQPCFRPEIALQYNVRTSIYF